MKKLIYSVIALAAVAVGCTKSEMIETPDFGGQAITFDTYIGKVPCIPSGCKQRFPR